MADELLQLKYDMQSLQHRVTKLEGKNQGIKIPYYTEKDVKEAVDQIESEEAIRGSMPSNLFELKVMLELGGFPDPSDLKDLISSYRNQPVEKAEESA